MPIPRVYSEILKDAELGTAKDVNRAHFFAGELKELIDVNVLDNKKLNYRQREINMTQRIGYTYDAGFVDGWKAAKAMLELRYMTAEKEAGNEH